MTSSTTVIVTGASAGIGEGIARRFLAAGARVINIDVNPPSGSRDGAYFFHQADLSDPAATRSVAREVCAEHEVDCLVNNAGTPTPGDLDAVSDAA
jgi:3-oxoacyl-[acyl-carrier protein] reductase